MNYLDLTKIAPRYVLTKTGNKTYKLNIAHPNEMVLIASIKDRHKNLYTKKYITIPKNKICLWYFWPAGRNQHKIINNGRRYKHVIIPRYIPLDRLTLNALGLLQAEMTKYIIRTNNLIFSNCEPNLHNIIIKFFKRFLINSNCWSWNITVNDKIRDKETPEQTKIREKRALNFWLRNTLINFNRKQNKYLSHIRITDYENIGKNIVPLGNLRICHSNIIIYQLILKLLKDIKKVILKRLIYTKYYLQGFFSGDGDVKLTPFKSIDSIRLASIHESERKFYSECLKLLEINSTIDKTCVKIHNQRNFIKVFKYKITELHPKRHYKFLIGMLAFKQIPDDLKKDFLSLREKFNNELNNIKPMIDYYQECNYGKYCMV